MRSCLTDIDRKENNQNQRRKGKYSALAKTALMAVLVSGTFTDNGYRMPSTAAVVSNFKKVSKDMKRHTLSVFVDDPLDARADDNGYFTMPLF